MRQVIYLYIICFSFCATAQISYAENNFCKKNSAYVVWDEIKVNCVNANIYYRYKDNMLQIINFAYAPKASINIEHTDILSIDNYFDKMNKGFEGCRLAYKKNITFLNKKAIEYKIQCNNIIGTRKSILLLDSGYSISLMGEEEYFGALEDVLNHIEILENP